jgi:hypothetical protein
MRQALFALLTFVLVPPLAAEPPAIAPPPRPAAKKVAATIETTLSTGQKQIRQFALDGDPDTYFASEKNASPSDHFSIVLDAPVSIASIRVLSGKPGGAEALDHGVLEVSSDGKEFEAVGQFAKGVAAATLKGMNAKVIRIRPMQELDHPLVIREIEIDSQPAVAVFKYPVEFVLDSSDAPEMKEWLEKAGRICERNYGMLCDDLMSPGFKPTTLIYMTLKNSYNGVAEASGNRILGSVKYFKSHLDDFGAMVHETTHCVQVYRSRRNPGWLVEGIADYERFFRYEPGNIGRLDVRRASYDGSYRVTAAFLDFVSQQYQPMVVRKLNALMREGRYIEDAWKEITGKTAAELNAEWQRSLMR